MIDEYLEFLPVIGPGRSGLLNELPAGAAGSGRSAPHKAEVSVSLNRTCRVSLISTGRVISDHSVAARYSSSARFAVAMVTKARTPPAQPET